MDPTLIRYALLAASYKKSSNTISMILGETFRSLGPTFRTVLYLSILGEGSFSIGIYLVSHYFESRGLLDFMKDLKSLKGLSPENYR